MINQNEGGIVCVNSSPNITNCTITENSNVFGGGIFCQEESSPTIGSCIISKNTAHQRGGGIICWSSSPILMNCFISENIADWIGGGMQCEGNCNPIIKNCIFTGNIAVIGAGIYCTEANILNCTITENIASGIGGGLVCHSESSPNITNCILWSNSPDEIYVDSGEPIVTYTDIEGGWEGKENIDIDPLFRNPANNDYHLQSKSNPDCGDPNDSPCIDAGDPSISDKNIDCALGLGGEQSDMGAYGGEAEIYTEIEQPAKPQKKKGYTQPPTKACNLSQNYPNPFNPITCIKYSLDKESRTSLKIYDTSGRMVKALVDRIQQTGDYSITWRGENEMGQPVSSGIYIYRLHVDDYVETRRMLLLK